MNSKLLLISVSIITLASCSTAYKTGQTPDDVYYSPARYYGEDRDNREENRETAQNTTNYSEERQIRLGINDRRWRYLDNDIYYNPYQFGYNYGYYYNPFYHTFPVYSTFPCTGSVSNPKITTPRMTNLGGYGTGYNYVNTPVVNPKYNTSSGRSAGTPVRGYNNSNNNTGSKLGNTLNKVFNHSNSSSDNNTNSSNSRSYSPSSSSSSSGSSSGGSSSRPARSGRN